MENNFGKKIQAKQESSLTTVWLKWDPPVPFVNNWLGRQGLQFMQAVT